MTRPAIICLLLALGAVCALADDFVVIRAQAPEAAALEKLPLVLSTDAEGLRESMGLDQVPSGDVHAEEQPSGRQVIAQLDIIDGQAQFALLLPAEPAGEREIRVWLQNAPGPTAGMSADFSAQQDGDTIVVSGPAYQVRHDPAVNAGILSQITFNDTGKVFEPTINDRLYNAGMGGFNLSNDPDAEVELVANGPYMREVRVRARYMTAGGEAPESGPRATYTFRYFEGLPVIQAEARVTQGQSFAWEQLHFLELHFKDDSFTHFAQDDPGDLQPFVDDSSSHRSQQWGALVDDLNVLGMTGNTLIYDGIDDYGRYLHGPWVPWDTSSIDLQRWLFVSAQDDALETMDTVASATVGAANPVVLTEGLVAAFDELSATVREWMIRTDQRGLLAGALNWRISLLRGTLEQGRPVNEVLAAARELQALAADDPADAAQWLPPTAEGRLLLADDGRLGVGLLQSDTGIQLVSLYDMIAGREMLAETSELFRITLTDAEGSPASLASSDGWSSWRAESSMDMRSGHIEATFEGPTADGLSAMTATLTCDIARGESRWWLGVANDTQWSIDEVTLPDLRAVRIGDAQSDDTLYVPHGYGRAFDGGAGGRFLGYYPSGSCALPMLLVSDETSGLYLCAHDPNASARMINSDRATSDGTPLNIMEPAPDASVAGNDFETAGEIVIARVDGGWYPATQRYRAWLQQNAPWWPQGDRDYGRPDRPAWLNDVGAWVLGGGPPESVLEITKQFHEFMDLPTPIHYYNWHEIPFDNDYPHYFPTKEGFREAVAELQAAGVRVVPYINGRLWDTDTESFQEVAYEHVTRDRDGEPYIEVYGSGEELAPMCISQQYWHDTLHEIVMRLMTEVNVDGVYMDQVAAARPRLCFDPDHGHPLAGGGWWTEGYWRLLERIQADIADVSAEKMLTTESNAEPYARWFDTYLMCNSLGDGLTPLFPAVYGSKILGFGRYMSNEDWDAPEALAQKQGQLLIWGTQLWWSSPHVIKHEFAGPWLRDLVHLRWRVREFFNEGRMLAPPVLDDNDTMVHADWHRRGLSATTPAIIASRWGLPDGRVLIPMVNVSEEPQTVTLNFDAGDGYAVQRVGPDGAEDLGNWTGQVRHEIAFDGVEAAAMLLTPVE
ncbi:MAG: DUF6259 domain-containing protein [Armatimonadota bacterium]